MSRIPTPYKSFAHDCKQGSNRRLMHERRSPGSMNRRGVYTVVPTVVRLLHKQHVPLVVVSCIPWLTKLQGPLRFSSVHSFPEQQFMCTNCSIPKFSRVRSVRYVPRRTVGIHRGYYRYRTLRYVRYVMSTGTGNFGKFSATSIPVPDSSVSSDINTGTGHFGKFGTTPVPVPAVPVCTYVPEPVPVSVQQRYSYRTLR